MTEGCWRIVVVAGKGGVGKTTTTINLAAALAEDGWRCLLVDCDPQANLTLGMGLDPNGVRPTVADVLRGDLPTTDAVTATTVTNIDLLPADRELVGVESTFDFSAGGELRLRRALDTDRTSERYDFIIFDTPSTFGFHTMCALAAAEHVLVPLQMSGFALRGLKEVQRTIAMERPNLNSELRLLGAVPTFVEPDTRFTREVLAAAAKLDGLYVFHSAISRSVRLQETSLLCTPVTHSAPGSASALEFKALAMEVTSALEAASLESRQPALELIVDHIPGDSPSPDDVDLPELELTGVAVTRVAPAQDEPDLVAAWLSRAASPDDPPKPGLRSQRSSGPRLLTRLFRRTAAG